MGDEHLSFEMTEVRAVFGERLALTRTRIGYSSGFPVEMLSVTKWDEEIDQLQKIVQFDGDDVDGALQELDQLRGGLDAEEDAR